ncbi:MAG: flippase-like domain-containing protein [Thermomicrobia bacterium]|nr:flippase-like domain-containing protein [Thermomicrobia bacterium]MCA1723720.1 flippase-like domain-containing protein [Thermomicrobia bacterium]
MTAAKEDEAGQHWLGSVRGRILLSVGFALLVLMGLTLFADSRKLADALRGFHWALLVPILLLTSFNYALRFLKWQYYLHRIRITALPTRLSARIFFANFTMALTPGKVGEVFKSLLLREAIGTPIAASAPIILAERLTDGIAMLILASTGLVIFRYGVPVFTTIAALGCLAFLLLQQRRLIRRLIDAGERFRFAARFAHHLHAFYDNAYALLRPAPLLVATVLGLVSWLGECVAFFLVLIGLGFAGTPRLFLTAMFVLAASTLIGSVSLLPGGLGAAEIGMTAMLLALVTDPLMTHDVAVAATLLIRFCTLWFGVTLGLVALATVRGLLGGRKGVAEKALAGALPGD